MATSVHHSIGKKKTAVASVNIVKSEKGSFTINNVPANEYFSGQCLHIFLSLMPFKVIDVEHAGYDINVRTSGGGLSSQAYAIRLAIARVLSLLFPEQKREIKKHGFLTRDSRIVERKKVGYRKARKKEQYSKR